MKLAVIIISAVLLIFAVLLFIPTYLCFEFKKDEKEKKTFFAIRYLFFCVRLIPKKKTQNKKKKKKENDEKKREKRASDTGTVREKFERAVATYRSVEDDLAGIILYAKRRAVTVREISFFMDIGLEEAMHTGLVTGGLYGVIYNVIALLDYHLSVEKCDVGITPDFKKKRMDISAKCILKVKNVHIMIIIFKVLKLYFKIKRGSNNYGRTSDSRVDGHGDEQH